MKTTLTIVDTEFQQALKEYIQYSRRTLAEILNKTTKDVLIFAGRSIKKASPSEIENAPDKMGRKVWGIYLAKRIASGNGTIRRKRKGQVQNRTLASGNYSYADIETLGRQILNRRKRAVGLLASAFYRAAAKVGGSTGGTKPGLTYASGDAQMATILSTNTYYDLNWIIKDAALEKVKGYTEAAIQAGKAAKTDDMRVYIAKKLQQQADRQKGK